MHPTALPEAHKTVQCPLCIHHGQAGVALSPLDEQHTLSWSPPCHSASVIHVIDGSLWKMLTCIGVEGANILLPTLTPSLHPSKVCAGGAELKGHADGVLLLWSFQESPCTEPEPYCLSGYFGLYPHCPPKPRGSIPPASLHRKNSCTLASFPSPNTQVLTEAFKRRLD